MLKLFKIMSFTIIFLISMLTFNNITYAESIQDIILNGDKFVNSRNDSKTKIFDTEKQKEGVSELYYITLGVGIFVAIVIGIALGIQFIIAGAEGKAKIKETLIPYIVGCIVVFGGFGIWSITRKVTQYAFPQQTIQETTSETQK
ncbi:MAG: hypothetical protein J6A89_03470 [Clostridia bacterium]|nr:hypothetical protein [Clostridia bacterium]